MGCYDTVGVPCPKCADVYDAQSKSGECNFGAYAIDDAPDDVIADVNRHAPFTCGKCGTIFAVELVYPEKPAIQRKVVQLSGLGE